MRGAWTAWQPRLAASPCPCRCVRVLLTQACAIQRKCASLHATCLPRLSAHGRSQLCEVQVFALLPRHQVATDPKPTSPDQSGRLFQGLDSCRSQSHVALVWRGRQLSPRCLCKRVSRTRARSRRRQSHPPSAKPSSRSAQSCVHSLLGAPVHHPCMPPRATGSTPPTARQGPGTILTHLGLSRSSPLPPRLPYTQQDSVLQPSSTTALCSLAC